MNFFDFMHRTLATNEPVWNYYRTAVHTDPSAAPERSAQFIHEYFSHGEKGDITYELDGYGDTIAYRQPNSLRNIGKLNIDEDMPLHLSEYRAIHTVSAFFLGIFLEKCLTQENCGVDISTQSAFFPFSYLWFLTCLYHDYGYIIEENWTPSCRQSSEAKVCEIDGYHGLQDINRKLGITYSPYQQVSLSFRRRVQKHSEFYRRTHHRAPIIDHLLSNSPSLKDGLQFNCGARITGFRYSQGLLMQYFSYGTHRLRPPSYNHGIIGGYLLFDRFLKIYASAYRSRYPEHMEGYPGIASFDRHGKHFCVEQLPVLAHIADCIASHNVWKASNTASETEYMECGLSALVGERFKKISFHDNPLLFILSIVDTIEPYKLYASKAAGSDAVRIWKSFDLSFANDTLTVSARYKCRPIIKMYEKAEGLKSWVDIKDVILNDNGKSISVKF